MGFAASAQEHCSDPQTQSAINTCAYENWVETDDKLNSIYRSAILHAKEKDIENAKFPMPRKAGSSELEGMGSEELLRRAQRAWIVLRDHHCLSESDLARGGSMQPMLYRACITALTQARIDQLTYLLADQP